MLRLIILFIIQAINIFILIFHFLLKFFMFIILNNLSLILFINRKYHFLIYFISE